MTTPGYGNDSYGTSPYGGSTDSQFVVTEVSLAGVTIDPQFQVLEISFTGIASPRSAMIMWNGSEFIPIDLYVWDGSSLISTNTPVYPTPTPA